eukprot:gene5257-8867_t
MNMLTSGTNYILPIISVDLRIITGFSIVEANLISSFSLFGSLLGILTGFYYDQFGPRFTSLLTSVLFIAPYTLMQLTLRGYLYKNAILFAIFNLIAGVAGQAQIVTTTGTNAKNFPPERKGLVVGTLMLIYGVGGALLSPLYSLFEGPEKVANYLTIYGLIGCAFPILNFAFLPAKPIKKNGFQVKNQDIGPFRMLFTLRFYLGFFIWGITTGCCKNLLKLLNVLKALTFLNNLGEIIISVNSPEEATTYLFLILLISNCIGRVLFGFLSDLVRKWISNPFLMAFISLGLTSVSIFTAFSNYQMLYASTIVFGIFFGGSMVIGPTLPLDLFGPTYYGTNLAVIFLGVAGTNISMSTVFSLIYEYETPVGALKCKLGYQCFYLSFLIMAGLCFISFLFSILLGFSTLNLYYKKEENKFTLDINSEE